MNFTRFPLRPTADQRAELIENITAVYQRATVDQRERGLAWYRNASDLARIVGRGNVETGAGIISALSPNNGWESNQAQALTYSQSPEEVRALGRSLANAERIAQGQHPLNILRGLKTRAFYLNISNPYFDGPVTIDRHAHDLAVGQRWGSVDRGLDHAGRYAHFQDAYNFAAAKVGVRPHELQAITWLVWREEK